MLFGCQQRQDQIEIVRLCMQNRPITLVAVLPIDESEVFAVFASRHDSLEGTVRDSRAKHSTQAEQELHIRRTPSPRVKALKPLSSEESIIEFMGLERTVRKYPTSPGGRSLTNARSWGWRGRPNGCPSGLEGTQGQKPNGSGNRRCEGDI